VNDDLVAAMERERLGGMPRWKVRPAKPPETDLATVTPLRRKPDKPQQRRAI
jgi:hypothetical protein